MSKIFLISEVSGAKSKYLLSEHMSSYILCAGSGSKIFVNYSCECSSFSTANHHKTANHLNKGITKQPLGRRVKYILGRLKWHNMNETISLFKRLCYQRPRGCIEGSAFANLALPPVRNFPSDRQK